MTRPLSSTSLSRSKIWIRTFNLQSRNNHLPSKITRIRVADSDTRSIHQRRLAILGGAIVFFTGLFATRRYIRGPSPKLTAFEVPEDVSDRYSKIARSFDNDVAFIESVYGYNWLRSWMIRKATGNVLEVSAGTGRNSGYYDLRSCKSLTFIDQIPEMTDIAQEKFKRYHPTYKAYRFMTQSALDPIEIPHGGYDTVVQTMGICSVADPVRLLRHLGSLINPRHGRILLLEHGKSYYKFLNNWLDSSAPSHADKYGCWWNKDIGEIVKDSGLDVVVLKRYHFGTTWWIEIKANHPEDVQSCKLSQVHSQQQGSSTVH